ncbi:MAG: rRNA ((2030)-N(6))-methyltransferase RlmJ [Pseudomonadota bacterium]|jgi:23S rRNA (adenine2030-N6)-methyltransferase
MFSYRHAFHAGNHADVLKHITLLALLKYLTQKQALTVIDTHAGAGLYRLDGDYSQTSGEADQGVLRLVQALQSAPDGIAPVIQDYLDLLGELNPGAAPGLDRLKVYPGSPYIASRFLQGRHKLKLYELHPTDFRALSGNMAQLELGRSISCELQDGFESLKPLLPPPSRRALVMCDPSYELKSDYAQVTEAMADALKRFATGTYAIWYPVIPRPEAHELPKKLKTLATRAGRPWLDATLTVKGSKLQKTVEGQVIRPGLPASGMFVINPPFTLHEQLKAALPQLVGWLGQDRNAAYVLTRGG